ELMLMEVDPQQAIGPRAHDHVRHELGPDGDARLVLSVLPRVAIVRHHHRDASRARAPCSVDEEQELHHVLRRRVGALHDEEVVPAHVLVDPDEDLAVGESIAGHLAERDPELPRDLFRQRTISRSRQQLESVSRYGKSVHAEPCKLRWDMSLVNSDQATSHIPPRGFEPRFQHPKCRVLPLDDGGVTANLAQCASAGSWRIRALDACRCAYSAETTTGATA